MTGIPTPEAVEVMTDIPPDRLDEIRDEFTGYDPGLKLGRVFGTPTVGEFRSLLSMAARALPLPRRYTGGPLEDGLYLWRRPWWPTRGCKAIGVSDGVVHFGRGLPPAADDKPGGRSGSSAPSLSPTCRKRRRPMADQTVLDDLGRGRLTTDQNGRPIVWERSGVLHLCEGSRLVPFDRGTFVLWTRCQMHDVPADAAWEQFPTERVTCAACLDRVAQEAANG